MVASFDTSLSAVALTPSQLAAVQQVMGLFAEHDQTSGVLPTQRLYCDGCQQARPMAGFLQYGRYQLCNRCATEYEVARMQRAVETAGQFVRDKQFGEADGYALEEPLPVPGARRPGAAVEPLLTCAPATIRRPVA